MSDPTIDKTFLDQLTAISKSLNEISDQATTEIAEFEALLSELRLGITAWVELSRETSVGNNPQDITVIKSLGYGRHKGKWSLLYSQWLEDFGPDDDDEVPLRDASREVRIAALAKLPNLLTELSKNAADKHAELSKQLTSARKITSTLKATLKSGKPQ